MIDNTTIGSRWSIARRRCGLSQAAAANDMGINPDSLGRIERDVRQPSLRLLFIAADYYNVTTDYLLGRTKASRA